MKLTEKKLRRIIRSVLIETYGKRKEPDSYQDVIRADLKSAFDDIQGLNSSRLPTHDTYTPDEKLCARYGVPCTHKNIMIIKKNKSEGFNYTMSQLVRHGDE